MHMRDPLFIGLNTNTITALVMPGVYTPCMILPMDKAIALKALHIHCVLWSLPITDHCTIGLLKNLRYFHPGKLNFARMNVTYLITSKRKLLKLVEEGIVTGWDDPRMPTIAGMRRRGYPPAALRMFCEKGSCKRDNLIEIELLESCVREELNRTSIRAMVVTDPVKVLITNYDPAIGEELPAENNPEDPTAGERTMSFQMSCILKGMILWKIHPKDTSGCFRRKREIETCVYHNLQRSG